MSYCCPTFKFLKSTKHLIKWIFEIIYFMLIMQIPFLATKSTINKINLKKQCFLSINYVLVNRGELNFLIFWYLYDLNKLWICKWDSEETARNFSKCQMQLSQYADSWSIKFDCPYYILQRGKETQTIIKKITF